jgi:hypothetical protein
MSVHRLTRDELLAYRAADRIDPRQTTFVVR